MTGVFSKLGGGESRMKPSVHDALEELRREQTQRKRVFPRWVGEGRLSQADADWRLACLDRAIDEISERIEAAEAAGRLL